MNIPLRRYWNLLVNYLRPQWRWVVLLALLLVTSIGLQLVNPQILRSFIDTAQTGAAQERLLLAALIFIGVALLNQVLTVAATYVGQNVGWTATNELRADLAAHCLRLDMSFHKARTPGEIIERIDGDVNVLSNFFSQFMIRVLANILLMAGVLVLLFREDWRIGTGLTGFALIALVILTRLQGIASPYWKTVREKNAQFYGFLGERLAGTADIRSSGATAHVMYRFYGLLRDWLPIQTKATVAGFSMWVVSVGIFALGNALTFGVIAYLWYRGEMTIGTAYLVFHYTQLLQGPIYHIREQLQDLQQASASIDRVQELLQITSKLQDGVGVELPKGPLAVEFEQIDFGYEADELVLHDLAFQLEPGKVLGLLGRTGSGKTTLARLLLRLYDPTKGQLCLGGVPIQTTHLQDLRQRVGMVTQDVQLFSASIRDNLVFFNPAIPDERIVAVLEDLGLGTWLRRLPNGLDTELDSGGSGLSAGEAQLLAFARLFLSDPGLVIMDEASSRLDPLTERLVERAVDKLLAGRTGIIIAHRLGTVDRVDEIMILDKGRILEHGPRARLAADEASRFSQLLQTGMEEVLA